MKKLLILGHAGHGKDTVSNMISELSGATWQSSSGTATFILPALAEAVYNVRPRDIEDEDLIEWCKKNGYRPLLKELISLYNTPDKTALTKLILKDHDIYNGMRDLEEFKASRHLFDKVLWVDASERVTSDSTMEIPLDEKSMYFIDNNVSIECTLDQVKLFWKTQTSRAANPFYISDNSMHGDQGLKDIKNTAGQAIGYVGKHNSKWRIDCISSYIKTSEDLRHLADLLDSINS